jgi:SAM-dependent methyltransferase
MQMNDPEWFEEWFDSPYYHILYKHRDDKEAEIFLGNLVEHINMPKTRAWDMACGRGRHALYLASKGVEVVGSDISESSILHAKEKESNNLSFFIHDMRNPIRVNYFDFALNVFTSFGYFPTDRENLMVISSAYKSLKKGGHFVLDFFNGDKVRQKLVASDEKEIEGITFRISKRIENNSVVKQIAFNAEGKDHLYKEVVKLYSMDSIKNMLEGTGFKIEEAFGDYELRPFDKENSDRLIFIAVK